MSSEEFQSLDESARSGSQISRTNSASSSRQPKKRRIFSSSSVEVLEDGDSPVLEEDGMLSGDDYSASSSSSLSSPRDIPTNQEFDFSLTEGQERRGRFADCEFEISPITDFIYVCGASMVSSLSALQALGLQRIVNCSGAIIDNVFENEPGFEYMKLDMVDGKEDDICWFASDVIRFVENGRAVGKKTLIHCEKGISRSCSFAIAHRMWSTGSSWIDAFRFVQSRRKICSPNTAFTCNLIELDRLFRGDWRAPFVMFRLAHHLPHDMGTAVLKLCVDPRTRIVIPPNLQTMDPRGVYVILAEPSGNSPVSIGWRYKPRLQLESSDGESGVVSDYAAESGVTDSSSPDDTPADKLSELVVYIWSGSQTTEASNRRALQLAENMRGILFASTAVIRCVMSGQEPPALRTLINIPNPEDFPIADEDSAIPVQSLVSASLVPPAAPPAVDDKVVLPPPYQLAVRNQKHSPRSPRLTRGVHSASKYGSLGTSPSPKVPVACPYHYNDYWDESIAESFSGTETSTPCLSRKRSPRGLTGDGGVTDDVDYVDSDDASYDSEISEKSDSNYFYQYAAAVSGNSSPQHNFPIRGISSTFFSKGIGCSSVDSEDGSLSYPMHNISINENRPYLAPSPRTNPSLSSAKIAVGSDEKKFIGPKGMTVAPLALKDVPKLKLAVPGIAIPNLSIPLAMPSASPPQELTGASASNAQLVSQHGLASRNILPSIPTLRFNFSDSIASPGQVLDGNVGLYYVPPTTVRSGSSGSNKSSPVTAVFSPRITDSARTPVDIGLIRGPTPIEELTHRKRTNRSSARASPRALDLHDHAFGSQMRLHISTNHLESVSEAPIKPSLFQLVDSPVHDTVSSTESGGALTSTDQIGRNLKWVRLSMYDDGDLSEASIFLLVCFPSPHFVWVGPAVKLDTYFPGLSNFEIGESVEDVVSVHLREELSKVPQPASQGSPLPFITWRDCGNIKIERYSRRAFAVADALKSAMGGGASLFDKGSQLTLSHDQRRKYREMYDEFMAEGLPKEEIKARIQIAFENDKDLVGNGGNGSSIVTARKSVTERRRPSLDKLPSAGNSANDSGKSNSGKANSERIRRRSFDLQDNTPTFQKVKDLKKSAKSPMKSRRETSASTTRIAYSALDGHRIRVRTGEAAQQLSDITIKIAQDNLSVAGHLNAKANITPTEEEKKHFCDLCRISFKSAALHEQHIRFSHLHARCVAEHTAVSETVDRAHHLSTVLHNCLDHMRNAEYLSSSVCIANSSRSRAWHLWHWAFQNIRYQNNVMKTTRILAGELESRRAITGAINTHIIQSSDKLPVCQLIYEGNKFFWKTHETLEIHMHLHDLAITNSPRANTASTTVAAGQTPTGVTDFLSPQADGFMRTIGGIVWSKSAIIEVSAFDTKKHRECQRLYLKFPMVNKLLAQDMQQIFEKLKSTQEAVAKSKSSTMYMGESIIRSQPNTASSVGKAISTLSADSQDGTGLSVSVSVPELTLGVPVTSNALAPTEPTLSTGTDTTSSLSSLPSARTAAVATAGKPPKKDIDYLKTRGDLDLVAVVEFILSKLDTTQGSNGKEKLVFTATEDGVTHATSPLAIPVHDLVVDTNVAQAILKPVVIPRRRRSTEAEVHGMLTSVRDSTEVLKELTNVAYVKAGLAPKPSTEKPTLAPAPRPPEPERTKGFHPAWLNGKSSVDEYESEASYSDVGLSEAESV